MRLADWHAGGRTFLWNGRRIFYREEGQGPVLFCLHGFPTASWDWHRVWPALTARFRVVAADLLGFGFSDKPRGHTYSIFEQADLVEALLAALEIRQARVLAHDYGDTVAQELLARQLESRGRVEILSICFLNGGLFPEAIRRQPIQKLIESPLGPLVAALLTEGQFRRSFARIFAEASKPSAEDLRAFWQLVTHNQGKAVIPWVARYQRERRRHRERWVGALVNARLLRRFVCGADDPVSGAAMAARYREVVPDPDVIMLEGVGHYPQLEAPQAVLDAFLAFVNRS